MAELLIECAILLLALGVLMGYHLGMRKMARNASQYTRLEYMGKLYKVYRAENYIIDEDWENY
jgi:hypothetical protein